MYLAADVIEYLMDTVGGGAQDGEHRLLRQSLMHAYRDLVTVRDWKWYETHDYVHVDQRYVEHLLPWGVQSVDSLFFTEPTHYNLLAKYVHPRDFQRTVDAWDQGGLRLSIWTIDKDPVAIDRYRLRILSEDAYVGQQATLTYRRRPRDLRLTGYEPKSRAGKVDWNGTEVIGAGTSFHQHMVGAVIRVSGDDKLAPESLSGITPYVAEGIVYSVPTNDKLYAFSEAGGQSFTGTRYIVSDLLDLSPGMYTALLSGTESWAARLAGKNVEGAYGLYGRDLRLAFESDAVAVLTGREHNCHCGCAFWWIRPGSDGGAGGGGTDGTCPVRGDIHGGDADSEATNEWQGRVFGGQADTRFTECGDLA